ncbi:MAG: cyclic nucleotide-binding domain-containing protein [Myxococcota bacterium]
MNDEAVDEVVSSFGAGEGLVIAMAALLVLAVRVLLPPDERRSAIAPLLFLLLHVGAVALQGVVRAPAGREALRLIALTLILLSIGRSGLLLLVRVLLTRRMARPLPRIFQDLLQVLVYLAAGLIVLRAAGVEPGSILTTSALLTAVIGLSLQDTLGNMFAGLAIQAQRPFDLGDWIQYDNDPTHLGKVVEMNWRAVTVSTLERVEVIIPNSSLATIRNFSKPTPLARHETFVWAPYDVPPHRVITTLQAAVKDVVGLVAEPPPTVLVADFTERGVRYWVRYFMVDFDRRELVTAEVRERLWYAMHRAGIPIPPPLRHVALEDVSQEAVERRRAAAVDARARALESVDLLSDLPEDARRRLAERSQTRLYAPDEVIIREGRSGHELFILERGEVRVLIGESEKSRVEVARLEPGSFFGEMSFMTGAPRRATVRATEETEVIVLDKDALQPLLEQSPELATHISRKLAEREAELGAHEAAKRHSKDQTVEERSNVLLDRIRRFFSL